MIDRGSKSQIWEMLIIDILFRHIHCTLNYDIVANQDSTARSHICWFTDRKVLYFDGCILKLKELIEFVYELLNIIEGIMSKELLF